MISQTLATILACLIFLMSVIAPASYDSDKSDKNPAARINYPGLHPGAQKVWNEADALLKATGGSGRFFFCGHRGWTKSSFAVRRILLFVRNTGLPAAWYSPTLKPITDAWENLFKKALGAENFENWMNKSEMILRIPGCGSIHFYSLVEPNNAAGPTYPFCIVDETGSLMDGIFESIIEPILEKAYVSYDGISECWCFGTPNRDGNPKNDFWFNLMLAVKGGQSDWLGWHVPLPAKVHGETLVPMKSPYAHPDYTFERAKRGFQKAKRKKGWRIEWLCEFISDDGGQFEQDAIEAQCILPAVMKHIPITDTSVYARARSIAEEYEGQEFECYVLDGYRPGPDSVFQKACDIGITTDLTCLMVLDTSIMKQVFFLLFLPTGQNRWFLVKEAIALVDRMFDGRFLVDTTGAGSHIPSDMATEYGISVEPWLWGMNKEEVLNYSSALLEGALLELFDNEEIKTQLDIVQRTKRASGRGYAIAAPKSTSKGVVYHDDVVTTLGQLTFEVKPHLPKSGRPGVEENDFWTIGSTAESCFSQDDGSIVILDEGAYSDYGSLVGYTG